MLLGQSYFENEYINFYDEHNENLNYLTSDYFNYENSYFINEQL